jgi:hypothetical protein
MDGQELVPIADNYKQRPHPRQAAWFYAQMVRRGQASFSPDALAVAKAALLNRPDQFLGWRAPRIGWKRNFQNDQVPLPATGR